MRKPPAHPVARSVGMAALEPLASGLRVVNWEGKVIEGLPAENEPMNVASRWNGIYAKLVSGA